MTDLLRGFGPLSVCCVIPADRFNNGYYTGNVVLVSRKGSPDDWGFPGGKVEAGESVYDAMVREVKEESGVVVDEARLILGQPSRTTFSFVFYATKCRLPGRIQDAVPATDTEGAIRVGQIHLAVGQWKQIADAVIHPGQRWRCRVCEARNSHELDTQEIQVWHPNTFHKTNLITIQALIREKLVAGSALDEVPTDE